MLRSRVIPCLLIHNKGLVKTEKFKNPKYVGDPINAVKIFNEKQVDELIVLDIDCSANSVDPDLKLITMLANECRMPLCYGGGIKSVSVARDIIALGVEKVAISSAALDNTSLLRDMAYVLGRQSVVVVLDVKKNIWGRYDIYTCNGKKKSKLGLASYLSTLEEVGVGEVVINSIDRDGTMSGYDLALVDLVRESISSPITVLGGASSEKDILSLIEKYKIIGAAAGSLFVFKGKYRAVLISYISDTARRVISSLSEKIWN